MVVRTGRRQIRIDVPDVLFASLIAAFCGWYLWDARAASSDVQNLLLIEPAAVAAFVLYALVLREAVHVEPAGAPPAPAKREPPSPRVVGSMVLLALYVGVAFIGFDLATYLYILASLIWLGERRVVVLVVVPLAVAAVIVYGLAAVSSIPLPLLWRWGH